MSYSVSEIQTLKTLGFSAAQIVALANSGPAPVEPAAEPEAKPAAKPSKKTAAKKPAAKPKGYVPARTVTGEFRRLVFSAHPEETDRAAWWAAYSQAKATIRLHEKRGEKRGRKSKAVKQAETIVAEADRLLVQARANLGVKAA